MNWKAGTPETGVRLLVKNLQGFDPFRVFDAVCRKTPKGPELRIPSENVVLRGRDIQNMLFVALSR